MDETVKMPSSWTRAVQRFRDGYDSEIDFSDATDVHGFLALLATELREEMTADAVEYWREKTREYDEELLAMFRKRIAEPLTPEEIEAAAAQVARCEFEEKP